MVEHHVGPHGRQDVINTLRLGRDLPLQRGAATNMPPEWTEHHGIQAANGALKQTTNPSLLPARHRQHVAACGFRG